METAGTPSPRRTPRLGQAETRFALKGPITTPIGNRPSRSVNVALRHETGALLRRGPAALQDLPEGVRLPLRQNVDLVLVRENTEDLYGRGSSTRAGTQRGRST